MDRLNQLKSLPSLSINCLICGLKTTSTINFTNNRTKISLLSKNLHVIFILRNILEVTIDKLVIFLQRHPNLEDWLSICENCDKLVNRCKLNYYKILEATKIFNDVKKEVIQVMKESTIAKQEKLDIEEQKFPNADFLCMFNLTEEIREFVRETSYAQNVDPFILGDQAACFKATKTKKTDQEEHSIGSEDDYDDDNYELIVQSKLSSSTTKTLEGNKSHKTSSVHSCLKCGSLIPTKRLLNGHLLKCTGQSLSCPDATCPRKFHNEKALFIHVTGVHKSKEEKIGNYTLRCPKCDKIYPTNQRLKIHYRNFHERSLDFRKKWSGPKKPRRKNVGVDQEQKFICETCGTKFTTNKNLKHHWLFNLECKILRNGSTVNCEKCGRIFASDVALKTHNLTAHENKYSVYCEICGKGYNGNKELEIHLWRSHKIGDRKKWTCSVDGCEIMVYSKRMLEDHLKMKHGDGKEEPGYMCGECGKGFWLNKYLDQHVRVVHKMTKRKMERKQLLKGKD